MNSEVLRRRSLYLTGDFAWNATPRAANLNKWGAAEPENAQTAVVSGAWVTGSVDTSRYRVGPLQVLASQKQRARRTFIIGPAPGQVATWPQEELPLGWKPAFATPTYRTW